MAHELHLATIEQAIILKELGFKDYCDHYYNDRTLRSIRIKNNYLNAISYACPTWRQIKNWLANNYRIHINIVEIDKNSYTSKITSRGESKILWYNNSPKEKMLAKEDVINKGLEFVRFDPIFHRVKNHSYGI